MRTKYVLSKSGVFAIFPEYICRNHFEVASDFMNDPHNETCSAGFLTLRSDDTISSWGNSHSLSVKSRPEDGETFTAALHNKGLYLLPPATEGQIIITNEVFGDPLSVDDLLRLRVFLED